MIKNIIWGLGEHLIWSEIKGYVKEKRKVKEGKWWKMQDTYIIYECVYFCSINTWDIWEYCILIHDCLSLYQKNLWVGAEP